MLMPSSSISLEKQAVFLEYWKNNPEIRPACLALTTIRKMNRVVEECHRATVAKRVPTVKKFSILYDLRETEIHGISNRSKLLKTEKLRQIICDSHVRKLFRNVKPVRGLETLKKNTRTESVDVEDLRMKRFLQMIPYLYGSVLRDIYLYPHIGMHSCFMLDPVNATLKAYVDTLVNSEVIQFQREVYKFSRFEACKEVLRKHTALRKEFIRAIRNDDFQSNNGKKGLTLIAHHLLPFL